MKNEKPNLTLDDKSVLLIVSFHKLGNTRKVSTSQIEVNADKTMLAVNKKLLDSEELEAIKTHDGKTVAWLRTRALPSLFKEGIYRLPNPLIMEVDDYLTARKKERAGLVKIFGRAYDKRKAEGLTALGSLANPKDYLTAEEAVGYFSVTWQYLSFSTPEALKGLKRGLFEKERGKIAQTLQSAEEEIRTVLRVSMAQLVKRMVTQLTPNAEGKKKKIYDSLTGNVEDFLNTFSARNIADDVELTKLVEQARAAIKGVTASDLRESDNMRETVKAGFTKIEKELDKMIVDKPARAFDFSE